ncbi:uncharacterized protein [Littorina saxatilis]|uniref:uncharacterized protein n=1 Tax=Littorina saxatilis TaxID=31220 RepID=UPI0038B531CC
MTSAYLYTSPLRVILLLTSSLACNVGVERKREGVNSTTRAPADFKYAALHPQLTDRPGLLGQNNMSSNHTVTNGAPMYSPQRHLNANHQLPRMDESVNEVHAGDHRPDYVTADDESDFDDTLTSLFASSSPGDMLDDAEIDELMNAQGLWRSSSNTVAKHLRPVVRILAGDDGLVSREMYRQLSKLIVYIAIPFIIIGVVTNVIALKVFRRLPRSVTNTHMTCLVCFDMAYLLFMVTSHLVVVIFRAASAQSSAKHFLHLYVVYKFCILCARQVRTLIPMLLFQIWII